MFFFFNPVTRKIIVISMSRYHESQIINCTQYESVQLYCLSISVYVPYNCPKKKEPWGRGRRTIYGPLPPNSVI